MRRFFLALFSTLLLTAMASTPLVSTGRTARFIDVDVHALVGGTLVTQNFASCFPSISELSVNMGPSYGIGFGASLNFNDFIGLGCEVNALLNYYKMTLAVADNEATSITNTFIRNHFFTANFPVFIRLKFNLGGNVRWIIDGGAYYTYGLGGRQKTTMYSAHVNELSQLITVTTSSRSPYYNSPDAFICSSYRGDIGLHLATSLLVSRRFSIGVRTQIGFKNQAHLFNGVKTPNVHNIGFQVTGGYHF